MSTKKFLLFVANSCYV